MKRILYICPFSPCCNHAGTVYTRQLLDELSKSCLIDLVYFYYKGDTRYKAKEGINVLKEVEISTFFKLCGVMSCMGMFPQFSARYNRKIRRFLQTQIDSNNYDVVYFDFSQSFAYSSRLRHANKILMAHDVMAQKYARMKTYLKPWAVWSERRLLKDGAVFTFSEKDCELIKELYGIDSQSTTFFLSKEVQEAEPSEGDYFVFFGGWGREENYEAIEWYLDNVNPSIPNVKCKVIGKGMPEFLRKRLEELPNFEYLGFVDNPYPIIARAKAEITPLRKGAGVKVKCIDALGCGTPVIGTEVAFEGIPKEFDAFMLRADTASDYIETITKLKLTVEERKQFKTFFIEKYNNKRILSYINGSN